MTLDQIRNEFEKHLKENRYDVATRLIYSDWLSDQGLDAESNEQRRRASSEWCDAARWIESFSQECGGSIRNYNEVYTNHDVEPVYHELDFEEVIQVGYDYLERGQHFIQLGSEMARTLLGREDQVEEFWKNWETVTGVKATVPDSLKKWEDTPGNPFSCSC